MLTQSYKPFAMNGPAAASGSSADIYGAIGLSVGSAVGDVFQTIENNKAIKRNMQAMAGAASVQIGQLSEQASFEAFKNSQDFRRTMGRVETAFADMSGVTAQNYRNQATGDAGLNAYAIERNRQTQTAAVTSDYRARAAQIKAQFKNPLLVGVQSAVAAFGPAVGVFTGARNLQALSQRTV